ncbi:MAG TPA: PIG-L family deacetylase [Acidobacteriaceae bacterium]|nr:PIG-L family deacetylase [Acidobacteriaceae bacterium]
MTDQRPGRPPLLCLTAALFLLAAPLPAQTPNASSIAASPDYQPLRIDRGVPALQQSLRKLATRASVMMIVAHPDDEDGGMLTYESRGQGARVALLTLNRGEGGQNIMSNDLWDQLALVRTQELLAADRRYGVDQYFTRVADFGFSKTLEEALSVWGHDRVLYDVVRAIRVNRPLVLTAVFVGGITDGHGQHQVSGEMAQEAFKAAGDPHVFPDQIKAGLLPWTPLKVYARVPEFSISPKGMYDYATGKWAPVRFHDYVADKTIDAVPSTTLTIPEGAYDPVLGSSYIQLAREGLGQQKSQNGGTGIPLSGTFNVPYHRYGSRVTSAEKEQSYFDGIDTSISGIAALAPGSHPFLTAGLHQIAATVDQATRTFSPSQPAKLAPLLAQGLKQTQSLMQKVEASSLSPEEKYNVHHELAVKEAQFNSAILEALGVSLTAVVAPPNPDRGRAGFAVDAQDTFASAVPGQSFGVITYLTNPTAAPVEVQKVSLHSADTGDWQFTATTPFKGALEGNQRQSATFRVNVPADAGVTKACFHRKDVEQSYYDLDSVACLDHPLPPYPLEAWVEFNVEGATVRAGQVVQTVQHVVGRGGVYNPLLLVPEISVASTATAGIFPLEQTTPATVDIRLRSNIKTSGPIDLHLQLPPGWQSAPPSTAFTAHREGEQQTMAFAVIPQHIAAEDYPITPVAEFQGRQFTQGYETVGYPGLRPYNFYSSAPYKLVGVDVKLAPGLKVGYVMGTGDDVPQALESMGVSVHLLQPADIASGDLSVYDTIVLGIRAYAARPELASSNGRLLDYVKQGGVLVVQYNSREYDHNYGPYPITLTGDPEKVVDESDPVAILEPHSPLFSWPNHITSADFQGWVEERGHSFMHSWDSHYQALTEVHDPGQDAQKGGLLYARYGKGAYVYVAYALYRQLPEGIPGAYRLFANLLSLPKAPRK